MNHCVNDILCEQFWKKSVAAQFLALCPLNLHSDYPTGLNQT